MVLFCVLSWTSRPWPADRYYVSIRHPFWRHNRLLWVVPQLLECQVGWHDNSNILYMDIMPTWPGLYIIHDQEGWSSICNNQWSPPHSVIQQTKDERAKYSWFTKCIVAYQWCTDPYAGWLYSCFSCYSYPSQVQLLWFQERLLYSGN